MTDGPHLCRCGTALFEGTPECGWCFKARLARKLTARSRSLAIGRPPKFWDDKENMITADEVEAFLE